MEYQDKNKPQKRSVTVILPQQLDTAPTIWLEHFDSKLRGHNFEIQANFEAP